MEENKNENQENTVNFKTVQNQSAYKTVYEVEDKKTAKIGFGKSVLLPFVCGILGCGRSEEAHV